MPTAVHVAMCTRVTAVSLTRSGSCHMTAHVQLAIAKSKDKTRPPRVVHRFCSFGRDSPFVKRAGRGRGSVPLQGE